MELGVPMRLHIGDVEIPDAPVRCVMHDRTVALHPFPITRLRLVVQRLDRHRADRPVGFHKRQQHIAPRMIDQQLVRRYAYDAKPVKCALANECLTRR